jgi:antirestriction protein ArdC
MQNTTERKDVYSRITAQIVEYLEKGVRPWTRPWNAEHAAGRITRPLPHNGQPYSGINVLSLWMSALGQNFTAPIWMTFRTTSEPFSPLRTWAFNSLAWPMPTRSHAPSMTTRPAKMSNAKSLT